MHPFRLTAAALVATVLVAPTAASAATPIKVSEKPMRRPEKISGIAAGSTMRHIISAVPSPTRIALRETSNRRVFLHSSLDYVLARFRHRCHARLIPRAALRACRQNGRFSAGWPLSTAQSQYRLPLTVDLPMPPAQLTSSRKETP